MSIQSHSCVISSGALLQASITPATWVTSLSNANSPADQGFEAFPTGGAGGYTYSWSLIGATGLAFVGGTTSKTCTVRATGLDSVATGTLRCVVTDAASQTAQPEAGINVTFGTPP